MKIWTNGLAIACMSICGTLAYGQNRTKSPPLPGLNMQVIRPSAVGIVTTPNPRIRCLPSREGIKFVSVEVTNSEYLIFNGIRDGRVKCHFKLKCRTTTWETTELCPSGQKPICPKAVAGTFSVNYVTDQVTRIKDEEAPSACTRYWKEVFVQPGKEWVACSNAVNQEALFQETLPEASCR